MRRKHYGTKRARHPTNKVMPFAKPNGTRLSDVVRNLQKEQIYMENLLRFGERKNKFGVTQVMCCTDGEYVKFSDIKDLLQTAQNKQNTSCCVVCGCNISLKGYCAGCQARV